MDRDEEMNQEQLHQVRRWEEHLKSGDNTWFDSDNYVDITEYYFNNGMYQKAWKVLEEANKYYPDDDDIMVQTVSYFASTGQYEYAIKIMLKAVEKDPSDENLTDLASLYFDSKLNILEAEKIVKDLLKRHKDDENLYYLLAAICYTKNDFENMEKYCRKSLSINHKQAQTLELYCEYAPCMTLKKQVINFLRKKIQEDPFCDLLWSNLGVIYYKYGMLYKSEEACDYAIAITEKGERRHYYKAECLLNKQDIDGAISHLLLAIKYCHSENEINYHLILANIYIVKQSWGSALFHYKYVDDAIQHNGDYAYLLNMALCYYQIKQTNSATHCIQKAMHNNVEPIDVLIFGQDVFRSGLYEQCVFVFYEILQTDTPLHKVRNIATIFYSVAVYKLGKKIEAFTLLESFIEDAFDDRESLADLLNIIGDDYTLNQFTISVLKKINKRNIKSFISDFIYPEIRDSNNFKKCLKTVLQ